MAIIGIYGCTAKFDFDKVVFTPVCWSLVSFAAPAEWTLSWCWVSQALNPCPGGPFIVDFT